MLVGGGGCVGGDCAGVGVVAVVVGDGGGNGAGDGGGAGGDGGGVAYVTQTTETLSWRRENVLRGLCT